MLNNLLACFSVLSLSNHVVEFMTMTHLIARSCSHSWSFILGQHMGHIGMSMIAVGTLKKEKTIAITCVGIVRMLGKHFPASLCSHQRQHFPHQLTCNWLWAKQTETCSSGWIVMRRKQMKAKKGMKTNPKFTGTLGKTIRMMRCVMEEVAQKQWTESNTSANCTPSCAASKTVMFRNRIS